MDGILNVNKPQGVTSFQVVALVRKLSREKRVGHAGTLDPMATGVLPVCLGQATRVVEFFSRMSKSYRAEVEFGIETDTYDVTGEVTRSCDPSGLTGETIENALPAFRGAIQQTPPMYSALKHHGEPLYKLARNGIEVERKARIADIYRLDLVGWDPPVATLDIVCGKGTYIRSIAHDLGKAVGCGAAMRSLVRTRYGPFEISESVAPEQVKEAFQNEQSSGLLRRMDVVLRQLPSAVLDQESEKHMKMGKRLSLSEVGEIRPPEEPDKANLGPELCRAYALDGRFIGVLRFNAGNGDWEPDKVLEKRLIAEQG